VRLQFLAPAQITAKEFCLDHGRLKLTSYRSSFQRSATEYRKAKDKESPPISTDELFHTSWNIIVTVYGSDGNLRYTPCGILP